MNQLETVIEKKGITWLLNRVKSESPTLYKWIQIIGAAVVAYIGTFVVELQTGAMTVPHENIILPICQFLVALFAGAGVVAATTTKSAALTTEDTKTNVINEAISKGVVKPVDPINTSNRDNDPN